MLWLPEFYIAVFLLLRRQYVFAEVACLQETDQLGMQYNGTISETKSGFQCQGWDSDTPHRRNYWPENPSEHANFCRNPEGGSDGPWCYTADPNKRWESCDISKCSECIRDSDPTGRNYNGVESHTRSGRLCQRWDVDTPHKPAVWPNDRANHSNFCRNPDGEPSPWCYTTDVNKRWEYCSIRMCSEPRKSQSCVMCKGEYYRGTLNQTKNGRTCQRWDRDFPQKQYYATFYPNLRTAENYCRNPDNEDQPWCYTEDAGVRWEYCDLVICLQEDGSLKLPTDMELTTECYAEYGWSYRGNVATTQSGKNCMDWSSQSPHSHEYKPTDYPCSGLEGNYCRNPFSSKRFRPWCFTTDSSVTWEYCDIPNCDPAEEQPKEPPPRYSKAANIAKVLSTFPPDPEGCYSCNGFRYKGTVNITVSGKSCQRWDSNEPHSHKSFSEWDLRENYCRSADDEPRPWCYTTDPDTRWEYCDIQRCTNEDGSLYVPEVEYTTACAFRRGETYRGTVSQTASGRTCAKWGSNTPHSHDWTPDKYPCSGLDENYCRKPDTYFNSEAPWCYTTDPDITWEYCNIPHCGPNGKPITTATQLPAQCGVQVIQPIFTTQPFEIVDGKIVKTDMESVRHLARIIGGEVVAHGTWPWLISLQSSSGFKFCGGTLIHKSWVLSAAHCLEYREPGDYMVVAGFHKDRHDSRVQSRAVKRHFFHEEKIHGAPNDVALVQLDSPLQITDFVSPACLPEPDNWVPFGTYCVAAGWGRTDDPNHPGGLKQVVVQTYDCSSEYFVCTGKRGVNENVCFGDSGGPLLCLENGRWVNHGIAAYIFGCSVNDGRAGWARVSKYVGWINRLIEIYG